MTVSAITGILIWPNLSIRHGDLDPEDYRGFPVYLKRRMRLAIFAMVFGTVWIAVVVTFIGFKRP